MRQSVYVPISGSPLDGSRDLTNFDLILWSFLMPTTIFRFLPHPPIPIPFPTLTLLCIQTKDHVARREAVLCFNLTCVHTAPSLQNHLIMACDPIMWQTIAGFFWKFLNKKISSDVDTQSVYNLTLCLDISTIISVVLNHGQAYPGF